MDWPETYATWKEASDSGRLAEANDILQKARRSIPNSKEPDRWDWFISALEDSETAGFVMAVLGKHSIPRQLLEPILSAGVAHGNASTIKMFVVPCIETFGLDTVSDWMAHCGHPDKEEMARYWYPSATGHRN